MVWQQSTRWWSSDLPDANKDISNHLCDLLDVFNLTKSCGGIYLFHVWKRVFESLIDILISIPRPFHKTQGFVTCISDFHKIVVTVLKSDYKKISPNNILYINVKRSEKATFLLGLDSTLIQGELYNNFQEPYSKLT